MQWAGLPQLRIIQKTSSHDGLYNLVRMPLYQRTLHHNHEKR